MYNLYSVYDRKAKQFSMPVAHHNDETAKRWFGHVVQNSDMVAKDLELFLVGQFHSTTGSIRVENSHNGADEFLYGDVDFICSADELFEVIDNE